MNKRYAVELVNVSTYYYGEKRPALRDISLTIPSDTLTLITGPNGAGKTTLLETILGLLKPKTGVVKVFGFDLRKDAAKIRRECSYVPQDFMKPPSEPFKARDVVAMGLSSKRAFGKLSKSDQKKVMESLRALRILDLAERSFGKLSGGQQQKVMLARALVREPRLLLLDEPFSAMDQDSRKMIAEEIFPKLIRKGCTIMLVSHVPPFEGFKANVVVEIESGELKEVKVGVPALH